MKKKFTYSGPVYSFKNYICSMNLETMAESINEANRNFVVQAKRKLNLTLDTNISIDIKKISVSTLYFKEKEEKKEEYEQLSFFS